MKESNNLGNSIFKGALWTVLMRFSVRLLGIISVLILARVLVPEDFGLVAKAVLISGFLEMCSQFGFGNALIKNQDADQHDYSTAWTLAIIRGVVIGGILIGLSGYFAQFLKEPALQPVFCVYGLATLISGFTNIGIVDFRKKMNFHLDFKFNLYLKLSSFFTTLTIALIWQTYWAFPIGILVKEITSVIVSFTLSNHRPSFSLKRWRPLFDFSKWMLSYNILSAVSLKLDAFILSRFGNEKELGLYTVAYEVAGTPSAEIAMPVARASLPGLSKLNQEPDKFRQMNADILANVLLITIPAGMGLSALSVEATALLLGTQWSDAAIYIEILAVFGITRVIGSTSVSSLIAYGLVDMLAKLSIAVLLIRLTCLPLGYFLGQSVGMTLGVLVSGGLTMLMYLAIQRHFGMLAIGQLFRQIWRLTIASIVMYFALTLFLVPLPLLSALPTAVSLLIMVFAGALLFVVCLVTFWLCSGKPQGVEHTTISWFMRKLPRQKLSAS